MKNYYVYILINKNSAVLYICLTNSLKSRIWKHKAKFIDGFTKKYNVEKPVYYKVFNNPQDAIKRETQIKACSIKKKIELINSLNNKWEDLYNFDILYI
jgi:putative endonuclease